MAFFDIYKRNQGKWTRIVTFASVMVMALIGARVLSGALTSYVGPVLRYVIPTAVVCVIGLLMFWLVNRPRTADFLIATEGEMKKVSWSSKKEIIGSTKVVIVTSFIIAAILFAVDMLFIHLFTALDILGS